MGLFSSLAAPLLGAAIGGISGGKNKTSTQSTAPVLPENVQKGYDLLIGNATDLSKQPYRDITRTRYEPSGMYGGLFDNPEMQALQQASDREYFANMQAPQQVSLQPAQPTNAQVNNLYGMMLKSKLQPDNLNLDEQAYNELGEKYAKGEFKPAESRGLSYLTSDNPFVLKLLRDSQQRNAALQNASMRG
jgi:hypothetical protein